MKVIHVTNIGIGGAGVAASRLHDALRKADIDSRMLVRTKESSDPFVSEVGTGEIRFTDFTGQGDQRSAVSSSMPHAPCSMLSRRLAVRARSWLGARLVEMLGMKGCSLNIFPAGLHKMLNASDADVIHLHWINNEMISIKEIAKIKKPIVWTLHDCWPLLGAEHHFASRNGMGVSEYWSKGVSDFNDFKVQRGTACRFNAVAHETHEIHGKGNLGGINRNDRIENSTSDVCEAGDSLANRFEKDSKAIANARIEGRDGDQPGCRNTSPFLQFLRSFAANKKSGSMLHAPCSMLSQAVNNWIFRKKQKAWRHLNVTFIAPSRWMAEQVRRSRLFGNAPVKVIPNGLDPDVFQPLDKTVCRRKWNLPLDRKLILFGAYNPLDPNKGRDLLEDALRNLSEDVRAGLGVVVFGGKGAREIAGLKTHWMGRMGAEKAMAELYNAADATCVPSRKESFGQTASESLACGVPVVAFRTSGLVDVIDHKKNGYLADPFNTDDLAKGIEWILEQRSEVGGQRSALTDACRQKAEQIFAEKVVCEKHISVYNTV